MGFLDSLLKGSGSSSGAGAQGALKVSMKFSPFRLAALKSDRVNMVISVKNESREPRLVSVDVAVPKNGQIGFDSTCLSKHCEKQVGQVKPGDVTEVVVPIFSSNQTKEGEYPIGVTAYTHYLDYSKVVSHIKKSTTLRVV